MQGESTHPTPGHDPIAEAEHLRSASTLVNRNVTVGGRRTSMRLEPAMWEALQQVCSREGKSLNELVTEIDRQRSESSLTAAIRVYLLRYFSAAATDEGHRLAGHGGVTRHFPV
jgi:predicted DNA-binding ribbon-helix-helix protein